jgi:hypothetical protein
LGLGRLRVHGRGRFFRVILHKIASWNVLPAVTATYFAAGAILRVVGDALDDTVVVSH